MELCHLSLNCHKFIYIKSIYFAWNIHLECAVLTQSCVTLCSPMHCSLLVLRPWNFPDKNTETGYYFLPKRSSSQPRDQTRVACISIDKQILYHYCLPGKPSIWNTDSDIFKTKQQKINVTVVLLCQHFKNSQIFH